MLRFGEVWVCAACKPLYVERLKTGIPPTRSAFRDLSSLTRALHGLLIADIAVLCLAAASGAVELGMLLKSGVGIDLENLTWSNIAVGLIGLLQLGVSLAVGIVFLRWIYLVNANARAVGATKMQFTPGWSIGWYFIPFANLWKPYQAMKEIWRASFDPENWRSVKVASILPLWWTLWILSSVLGQAAFRATMRADERSELIAASVIMLVSDAIDIPLAIVAIALVTRIWAAQRQRGVGTGQ